MRRSERLYDAERYAVLAAVYARGGTDVDQSRVGAYRTKTVRAGEYLYVSCYPLVNACAKREMDESLSKLAEEAKTDRKKRRLWDKYNNARRTREFEMLVNANFGRGDFHVALTYAAQNLDLGDWEYRSREEAIRDAKNFIERVKRLLRRHGCDLNEFRWLRCTVTKEGDQEAPKPHPDRHHHHILMHGIPEELRGDVERLWPFGYANADRLQPDHKGVAAMAGYIARQDGSANGERYRERSYTTSRNIIRPEIKTSDVRISRRRVSRIAADVRANGAEVFAKVYPGYTVTEPPKVMLSDFVAGAYIYAVLRQGGNYAGKNEMVYQSRYQRGKISRA